MLLNEHDIVMASEDSIAVSQNVLYNVIYYVSHNASHNALQNVIHNTIHNVSHNVLHNVLHNENMATSSANLYFLFETRAGFKWRVSQSVSKGLQLTLEVFSVQTTA